MPCPPPPLAGEGPGVGVLSGEVAVPIILIVDDEANIRDVVQYALSREGFETRVAADGRQALSIVEQGGIDLVVLDILMPELDGLSVCRKIREKGALPI